VGGDPRDVHTAASVLDHEQDVEAAQKTRCRRGRSRSPGSQGPTRTGTVARSAQLIVARDRVLSPSRSSRQSRRPRDGRGRPTHLESLR
jgi:hypothetical protein